jgi:hypothetical protein
MPTRRLRHVLVEAPDPHDRVGDKVARIGTELAVLISSHLPAGPELASNAAFVSLLVRPKPVTNFSAALFDGMDMIDLDINPSALLALAPDDRRDVLFAAMVELLKTVARARRWDPAVFDTIAELCRADGLRMRWSGRLVWNRLRSHQARALFWFEDDGSCQGAVEILDRAGARAAMSPPGAGWPSLGGFARAAKTLRWVDAQHAGFVPHGDRFGIRPDVVTASIA